MPIEKISKLLSLLINKIFPKIELLSCVKNLVLKSQLKGKFSLVY